MTRTYDVTGMTCGGCQRSVERVVGKLDGVLAVRVDLATGKVEVDGNTDGQTVIAAIEKAGFEAKTA
ncbi:MAG: heavy-metal-associated domain-containing protein [Deltaproteobacteria bacterium]|nr:MAG: heavy-metal-associated domain-containing protein [Deltaproteobacteria bacterium]